MAKKEINFKIIELPTHQVLVSKDFDDDDDSTPLMKASVFIKGVKAVQKFGYKNKKDRDSAFNKFTYVEASSMLEALIEMFNK